MASKKPKAPSPATLTYRLTAIAELTPYPENARTHSADQVNKLAASIKEFGFLNPVIIDGSNGIIAGHGRVLAAKQLGIKDVPTISADALTDAQKRAYILADNRMALDAGWDEEKLQRELLALDRLDFDLDLTGFSQKELTALLNDNAAGMSDPEKTPDAPKDAATIPGDVYLLGKHRLVCGDSTNATDVSLLLAKAVPNLMVTDPPYGVNYDADWRNKAKRPNGKPIGASAIGKVKNDDSSDWRQAYALFPGCVAYVWHAGNKAHEVAMSLFAADFEIRSQIIWAKSNMVIGRGHYHPKHEPCWYAVRKGKNGNWNGDRKQTTLWDIDKPVKSDTGHSTQKPIECMQIPIENNSKRGDIVYDPFLGSGTTLIAAEMSGRICYGMELDPAYCDVIVARWENFTGKKAERIHHGKETTGESAEEASA